MRGALLASLLIAASPASAQFLSNLERDRPVGVEDAIPVPYRGISAAFDWIYNVRSGGLNDEGPGFTIVYGAVRNLELGASQRYVTSPGRNALRGISSGDLELHALYALVTEGAGRPALGARVGVVFPTGLDSQGTDLQLAGLATRSFDSLRLHVNVRWSRLGDTVPTERADRFEAGLAVDFLASGRGRTDTLVLASVSVRSSPVVKGPAVADVDLGVRHRVGTQTILFGGLGSELSDKPDRPRVRVRVGLSHVF
jgi:hypothetical protein